MKKVTIVGAGLVGSLLAILLGRRGYKVSVFERRPDLRKASISAGRSINLALSDRGLRGLARAQVDAQIKDVMIPMRGRMLHQPGGASAFQPYGRDDQWINSVSRGGLNMALLDLCEKNPNVTLYFQQRCTGVDLANATVHLEHTESKVHVDVESDLLFGSDGAFSAVRYEMLKQERFNYSQ